jgi:hypothetical protein
VDEEQEEHKAQDTEMKDASDEDHIIEDAEELLDLDLN